MTKGTEGRGRDTTTTRGARRDWTRVRTRYPKWREDDRFARSRGDSVDEARIRTKNTRARGASDRMEGFRAQPRRTSLTSPSISSLVMSCSSVNPEIKPSSSAMGMLATLRCGGRALGCACDGKPPTDSGSFSFWHLSRPRPPSHSTCRFFFIVRHSYARGRAPSSTPRDPVARRRLKRQNNSTETAGRSIARAVLRITRYGSSSLGAVDRRLSRRLRVSRRLSRRRRRRGRVRSPRPPPRRRPRSAPA